MSPILVFALFIAAFLSSAISAVAGMAGGVILLSFMSFFMELKVLIPIHGLVQLSSNSTRALGLLKHVEKRIFLPCLLGLPVGTLGATLFLSSVERSDKIYFLVAGLIFYVLFKPKKMPSLMLPYWSFGLLAVGVGFLNPLIGAIGPVLAPFFLRDDLKKEQIVATTASVQTVGHFLKIPAFLYLGFPYQDYWLLILLMVVGVILGTRIGLVILRSINETIFRRLFRTALFLAAVRLIFKAIG